MTMPRGMWNKSVNMCQCLRSTQLLETRHSNWSWAAGPIQVQQFLTHCLKWKTPSELDYEFQQKGGVIFLQGMSLNRLNISLLLLLSQQGSWWRCWCGRRSWVFSAPLAVSPGSWVIHSTDTSQSLTTVKDIEIKLRYPTKNPTKKPKDVSLPCVGFHPFSDKLISCGQS